MNEHPILFSGEMIRAILAGKKTQTRRIIKPQPEQWVTKAGYDIFCEKDEIMLWGMTQNGPAEYPLKLKYQKGDRLWVRETAYIAPPKFGDVADCNCRDNDGQPRLVGYVVSMDGESVRCAEEYGVKITPSNHMPRWASRITLEITNIRVERVLDITRKDAWAEGIRPDEFFYGYPIGNPVISFGELWDKINKKPEFSWRNNPWVWVIGFGRVKGEA